MTFQAFDPTQPSASAPLSSSPAAGRRRWGLVVLGIVLATIGLSAIVGGALATAYEQTRSAADPVAEGRTPGSLSFNADAVTYRVEIQGERFGANASSSVNTSCTVVLADDTSIGLDGATQAISEQTGNIASVGSFTAVEGATAVSCRNPDDGVRFFVAEESSLQRAGMLVLIGGFVVGSVGAALILVGVFVRKQPRVTM